MANRIITVLCEGPHDVAFICRILKTRGFTTNENTKIISYPPPFNQLFKEEATHTDVEQLNLAELRKILLPTNTLIKGSNFVFIYSMGGDSKKQSRQKILTTLKNFLPLEGEILRLPTDTTLSLLYFLDADAIGISARLTKINEEIKEAIPEVANESLFDTNGEAKSILAMQVGAFIFTGADNNTGKLEDILVPLMKEGNGLIFENAEVFLNSNHDDARLFPLKISKVDGVIAEARSIKAGDKARHDQKKSLVCTVGQLQRSGKANTVCISDCDYLTLNKIQNNPKCQEILQFFNQFEI